MTVLVTGAAGFIGFHVARELLRAGTPVLGLDNLNAYYDVKLKEARLAQLAPHRGFSFVRADIADRQAVHAMFRNHHIETVIHLAAQAGVRHSLADPHAYTRSNIEGFLNILEGCRERPLRHLIYASSSSVYGALTKTPFSVQQNVDHPISLYAATKKSNELMAHTYSHLFGIPTTGLRFFTVYGPWGRPDMALFLFTRAILAGEPIRVFNHGSMQRDFTYIDDVVEGVIRLIDRIPAPDPDWSGDAPEPGRAAAPYRIYNIGNHRPVQLMRLIEILEQALGRKAIRTLLPMQPGDVPATFADIADLEREIGFAPNTPIEVGVERFVAWYRDFYEVAP